MWGVSEPIWTSGALPLPTPSFEVLWERSTCWRINRSLVGRYRAVMRAPYRIVYRVTDEEVLILRVWDTRRDPETFHVLEEADDDE